MCNKTGLEITTSSNLHNTEVGTQGYVDLNLNTYAKA